LGRLPVEAAVGAHRRVCDRSRGRKTFDWREGLVRCGFSVDMQSIESVDIEDEVVECLGSMD
jgi:hypothetical protein